MAAVLAPAAPAASVVPAAFAVVPRSEAFGALHARFSRPLRRFFASYRLNAHDAEDFTQEVFLRLASEAAPRELRSPEAFVFTLARNLVRDRARRLHTHAAAVSVPLHEVELRCETPGPAELLEHGERLEIALAALARVKPATRRAFVLHRVHGYSYAEIARASGVSVSMIEKHVMAAIAAVAAVADARHEGD